MTVIIKKEFEKNIPEIIKKTLGFCSNAADEKGLRIFLIGGIVRDIIISKKNFDVDLTVQGNAIEFAEFLQNKYPETCKIKELHNNFKTAKILFCINNETVNLDLASTRKESYPYPSSLPVIEEIGCELYEDVIRRDFTINSMALSLNKSSFCELIDYLGGYNDLKEKKLEVLHPLSFIDDPTRIIRGLKFSVRFGYKFGRKTETLLRECLNSGRFNNLAGERIKLELKQALNANKAEYLIGFINEDIYKLVDTAIPIPEDIYVTGYECQNIVDKYCSFLNKPDNIWLIYLSVLLIDCPQEQIRQIAEKLYLSKNEENILQGARRLRRYRKILNEAHARFEIYEFFEKTNIESLLAFLAKNKNYKDKVDLHLKELKNIHISIDGNILINMGIKPGPVFGEILKKVLKARINQEISSEEEIEFVKNLSRDC